MHLQFKSLCRQVLQQSVECHHLLCDGGTENTLGFGTRKLCGERSEKTRCLAIEMQANRLPREPLSWSELPPARFFLVAHFFLFIQQFVEAQNAGTIVQSSLLCDISVNSCVMTAKSC